MSHFLQRIHSVYAINLSGILEVIVGFFCLNDPDAAFLGFANLLN